MILTKVMNSIDQRIDQRIFTKIIDCEEYIETKYDHNC